VKRLVFSCEHGGREVPPDYAEHFAGHEALLETHRGWDPGALELARQMAEAFGAPLFASTTTRLLVDLNRSPGNPTMFSELTAALTPAERQRVVDDHYRPHRSAVEEHIARRIAGGEQVIHIAWHSFTPVLHGEVRRADVAWMYEPRRSAEVALSLHWIAELARRAPGLRLRRNYPYHGRGDGLSSTLRKRHAGDALVTIGIEVNQRIALQGGREWAALCANLGDSLAAALARPPHHFAR